MVIDVCPDNAVILATSSKGMQLKWYQSGYWVKTDIENQTQGLSEELASLIASCIFNFSFVPYTSCIINNNFKHYTGCVSKDFKGVLDTEISLRSLIEKLYGNVASYKRRVQLYSVTDRLKSLMAILGESTGYDFTDELCRLLLFDCLILNTDRHLGNISVVRNSNSYYFAPAFDNGNSLLYNLSAKNRNGKAVTQQNAKTITASFENQAKAVFELGIAPLNLDYSLFLTKLNAYNTTVYSAEMRTAACNFMQEYVLSMKNILWY